MAPKASLKLQKPSFLLCWAASFSKEICRVSLYIKEYADTRPLPQKNGMQKEGTFKDLNSEELCMQTWNQNQITLEEEKAV